ncbi:MAG: autotransporter domain-containing protein, partial [Ignavibacteriales bacterium]
LRDSVTELGGGRHPGFWIKALGNDVERSSVMFRDFGGGKSLTYDSGYNQKTHGFVGGLDLLNVQGDGYAWALGVNAGHVTSDADYKVTASKTRFEGNTYGVYASYLAGPLFLDGIVNVNDLDMDLGFVGAGSSKSNVKTTGAQAEGGYRIFVNEGSAWLEPIATLAYIKRDFDAAKIGNGLTADLGSGSVFKGALGLRLGGKMDLSAATVGLAITGRVWDEFRGDHDVVLTSPGQPQLMLADVQPKTLGDVGVTLNVMSKSRRVSGFADYGFKFREGYSDSTASLGVRVNF